eukprot:CAMPEP_0113608706 /NCGR_PEP_ID=MMETSP0017_2-20120614/4076_1 /TAXON_ID=2856 /ORGANISM="Cylindrotheca closterium" /LENGTH=430 /DNA_ID=CAMNT_0000517425 /DNA_START=46 /DNA_END=1334 /DNA_ORIENTATION=- /assembly_acc=CAM_ASM_000147
MALEDGVVAETTEAQNSHKDAETSNPTETSQKQQQEQVSRPAYILPAIVASQFAGTALWFAGNAVLPELGWDNLDDSSLGYLTSSVQFGFILGTFVFALLSIADRFLPTKVFALCALAGAACNALLPVCSPSQSLAGLIVLRLTTGFFLAGIYPVGMKVAADWFETGLGKALGWLVGALAVGSSFPFLLRQIPQSWEALIWETSGIAAVGGLVIGFLVPDGPYRKAGNMKGLDPSVICTLFTNRQFAAAAISYWGHMWELYAFWTWTPVVWEAYLNENASNSEFWSPSLVTFLVIAVGGLGCVVGGYLSLRYGSAAVAFGSLATSGALCLLSPLLYMAPLGIMFAAYLIWGMAVVADSPQFSTLVAQTAPAESKGTALTIVNCIGFTVTIGSIQLLAIPLPEQYLFLLLVPGPIIGLYSLWAYHLRDQDS